MTRIIIGVVVGYVIFAVSAALLFQLSGHSPHGVVSNQFMLLSIVYGMLFAALGGWVAEKIGRTPWKAAIAVMAVIAVGAIVSLLTSPSSDARWSQWSAVIVMAPSALIGGWLATRSSRR
ncbi:MAG TPA: hypothetical protein VGM82_04635 [Gemmatimonadaceae bacterium]